MSTETWLGKITAAHIGHGGYQDAMLGFCVTLTGPGCSIADFRGTWGPDKKRSEGCRWTEADRDKQHAETMRHVGTLLLLAKKRRVQDLVGVPVEVTCENGRLKSWRILTEVL